MWDTIDDETDEPTWVAARGRLLWALAQVPNLFTFVLKLITLLMKSIDYERFHDESLSNKQTVFEEVITLSNTFILA